MCEYSCYVDENNELRLLKRTCIKETGQVPRWTEWEAPTQDDLVDFVLHLRQEHSSPLNY